MSCGQCESELRNARVQSTQAEVTTTIQCTNQTAYSHCWSSWADAGCYRQVLAVIVAGAGCYEQVMGCYWQMLVFVGRLVLVVRGRCRL